MSPVYLYKGGNKTSMKLKPFIELLRRATKSKYTKFLMRDRMIMGCYSVDDDSDIGLHYILYIPEAEEYNDPFYDMTLIIEPKELLAMYARGHAGLLEAKKKVKAKPKDVKEELHVREVDHKLRLCMLFTCCDEVIGTEVLVLEYPVSSQSPIVENICNAYQRMLEYINAGGIGIAFDASRYNLYQIAVKSPQIYFFKIDIRGERIKVPIYKSMLQCISDPDEFYILLEQTDIDHLWIYAIQLTNKGLTEQYIGYIQNF